MGNEDAPKLSENGGKAAWIGVVSEQRTRLASRQGGRSGNKL